MLNKKILTLLIASVSTNAFSQKIDFNLPNKSDEQVLETDYTGWAIGRQASAENTFTNADGTETVKISVKPIDGTYSNIVACNWWKQGCSSYSKLVSDGLYATNLNAKSNYEYSTTAATGMQFTIEGLSAGSHTITAYHNNTDFDSGKLPPVDVIVNGVTVHHGVEQTFRAKTESASALSYLKINVAEGEKVVVQYIARPVSGITYTNTTVVVNALIFDRPNPRTQAMNPQPENLDLHADADSGNLTLSWDAASSATKHHLYFGTSEAEMKEIAVLTDNKYNIGDLYCMNTYYWRVDEEDALGNVFEGNTWKFKPRKLAFPDAEGYGRFAIGGRGGQVYHVTTLEDNADVEGSFRYGITKLTGPRTIVFDVSGIIKLEDRLTCSDEDVTIACQTAPGHGICFSNNPFGVGPDNIVRFMRLRKGAGETSDGIGMAGCDYSILDHASISWTIDEAFSSRNGHNITLQRTMISEALGIANHKNYGAGKNHGFAATIGGDIATFHHNLLADCMGRNWSLGGALDGAGYYAGKLDIFNNVVYNWGGRATDGGAHEVNFVSNYYKMGYATTQKILLKAQFEGTGKGTQSYYVNGNIRENLNGTKTTDKEGDTYTYVLSGGQVYDWNAWVDKPFFESYAKIESASDAYKSVCSNVGATMPFFDAHDQRIISETVNKTYTYIGSKSGLKGQIDDEKDCGGYEIYPEEKRADDYDTDKDGIPNWYETIIGTDVNTANNNADPDHDGWTQLEDYLEFISHPYTVLAPGCSTAIDAADYFKGYTNKPAFTVSCNNSNVTASVSGSKISIAAGNALGTASVSIKVTDAEGSTYEQLYNVAVGNNSTTDIQHVSDETASIVSYKVYTLNGKLVLSNSNAGGLNINALPMTKLESHQTYLLKATDKNGVEHTAKMLVD